MQPQENAPIKLSEEPSLYTAQGLSRAELVKEFNLHSDPTRFDQSDPILQARLMEIRALLGIQKGEIPASSEKEQMEQEQWDRDKRASLVSRMRSNASPRSLQGLPAQTKD